MVSFMSLKSGATSEDSFSTAIFGLVCGCTAHAFREVCGAEDAILGGRIPFSQSLCVLYVYQPMSRCSKSQLSLRGISKHKIEPNAGSIPSPILSLDKWASSQLLFPPLSYAPISRSGSWVPASVPARGMRVVVLLRKRFWPG